MKITGYVPVHYGREWLHWALKSIENHVDNIKLYYTSVPSYGFSTKLKNPETAQELKQIASVHKSVEWITVAPRDVDTKMRSEFAAYECKRDGADFMLICDADEIWAPEVLENAIGDVVMNPVYKNYRVSMRHFWRSLKWVCDDACMPVRIINLDNGAKGDGYLNSEIIGQVWHMGYAQTPAIIYYKQDITAHKNEWRKGWFENIFLPWQPGMKDVHPTGIPWNPVQFHDTGGVLESICGDHPYWGLDLIK